MRSEPAGSRWTQQSKDVYRVGSTGCIAPPTVSQSVWHCSISLVKRYWPRFKEWWKASCPSMTPGVQLACWLSQLNSTDDFETRPPMSSAAANLGKSWWVSHSPTGTSGTEVKTCCRRGQRSQNTCVQFLIKMLLNAAWTCCLTRAVESYWVK